MSTRSRFVQSLAAHVAILATAASSLAAQAPDLARITDRVFAEWNSTHGPGCAVGIAQGGRTLLTRGYGMADLANGIAIGPKTVLESGSVAKQFTATAVLLLMQDGRLTLEDDVRKHIPELPVYDRPITIRHLLTHTSGLREWSNLVAWQGWPRGSRVHTQPVVLDLIVRQKSLNYPVGDYYSYTNSGFLLLRTIVERVSGQPFARFTTDRIFTPLGMRDTQWRDDHTRIVPGLAMAYARRAGAWHLDMPLDDIIAAGGLLTTVHDWLRWNDALTAKTLGAAWGDSLTRRMRLTGGTEIQYALGIVKTSYRGLDEIQHSGSTAGYSTFLARYPGKDNLSIAVLCNAAGAGATGYTHAIVDAMYPDLARAPVPDTVALLPADAAALAGIYRDTRTNTTVILEPTAGGVRRGNAPVRALRDGTMLAGPRVRLDRAPDGTVRGFAQATADGDTVRFVRVGMRRWQPAAAELAAFAGRYRNDEIGVLYDVRVQDGALVVAVRAGMEERLVPTYQDAFDGFGGSVRFTRDARGRVTAMRFGAGRVWDLVSTRER